MWALFTNSQPQNINPKNSFKAAFLYQQIQTLQSIQKQTKNINLHLAKTLRLTYNNQITKNVQINHNKQYKQCLQTLKQNIQKLSNTIIKANQNYQETLQNRDLQKIHDHLFFKSVMKNYDDKRKLLKNYTVQLQNKVQEKQYVTVSHRSYRGVSINLTNHAFSEINLRFKKKIDDIDELKNKLKKSFITYDNMTKAACQRFLQSDNQKIKKLQQQPMQEEMEMYGLWNLLVAIKTKEKIKNSVLKQLLKQIRATSNDLNLQNQSLREAFIKLQNETNLAKTQNKIIDNKVSIFRYDCLQYLKQLSQKIKIRFNEGINYNRSKYRSKSLINLPFVNNKEKTAKNTTKDTYQYQKNQELQYDLSSSFMQHCQYLISQKFITEENQQNV